MRVTKKLLKLFLFYCVLTGVFLLQKPFSLHAASVSLIQSRAGVNCFGGTTCATAYSSNNTAGNTSVVLIQWINSGFASLSSVTDSQGNIYTVVPGTLSSTGPTPNYGNIYTQIAFATNIKAGANTVTAHWSTDVSGNFVSLYELSPSTLDLVSVGSGSSATPSAGTVITSSNGEFGLAAVLIDDGIGAVGSFTPGSGWTMNQNAGGGSASEATEYQTQALTGSLTGNFSHFSGTWVASMAVFKDSSGGTQPTTYAITSSAGTGGAISPSGTITVNSGSSQTFAMTPNSGYSVSSVTVDSSQVGAVASYTFSNITANHTISAAFISNPPAGGQDTTPPSTPTNLAASAISSSQINLSWTASTDNVSVTDYKIYRNGSQIGTSATNIYNDTGLSPSTTYSYTVSAYDAANNNSSQSTSAQATTQSGTVASGNIYIAQTAAGSANGTSCSNAYAYTFFNSSANWGSGTGKIGPGVTVHLCGTITGAAGATGLTFQGSGTSGNPITVLFESGAVLQAPYWTYTINMTGRSYVTIDGGTNGIIQNTDNGDLLTYRHTSDQIIANTCDNCTVKNLTIRNSYVHVQGSPYTNIDQTLARALTISGSNWLVTNNTIHDGGWLIENFYENGDTNVEISHNDIYNFDHGIAIAPAEPTGTLSYLLIHDNKIHDAANWDCTALGCHHDGIHIYAAPTDTNVLDGLYVYNNYFYGNWGTTATGHVYVEGGISPAHLLSSYWWNNVFEVHSNNEQNTQGWVGIFSGAPIVFVNNTMIGEGYNDISFCYGLGYSLNQIVFKNNVGNRCGGMVTFNAKAAPTDVNYNYYGQSCNPLQTYNNCFFYNNSFLNSFLTWQSTTGWDVNSLSAKIGSSYNSNSILFNADGSPQSGSPVIGVGANLFSMATGPMASIAFDTTKGGTRTAIARPASGPWDIGAYQYISSGATPIPGDLNVDHIINSIDYSLLNTKWLQNYPSYDLQADGLINTFDYAILKNNWGKTW